MIACALLFMSRRTYPCSCSRSTTDPLSCRSWTRYCLLSFLPVKSSLPLCAKQPCSCDDHKQQPNQKKNLLLPSMHNQQWIHLLCNSLVEIQLACMYVGVESSFGEQLATSCFISVSLPMLIRQRCDQTATSHSTWLVCRIFTLFYYYFTTGTHHVSSS